MEKEYNYYEVLRVLKDVLVEQIKKVYYSLVCQYYFDVNLGDINVVEKFKEINLVYEIFFDLLKWFKYDKNVEEVQELYKCGVFKSQ